MTLMKRSRMVLIKLRITDKMQEVYEAIANEENDGLSRTVYDHNQNEINRRRETKKEREREMLYRERIRQKYLDLLKKTNSSILKDLVRVTADQSEYDEEPVMTFDPSKECRIDKFFSDEQIQNEDAERLIQENQDLKQQLEDSQDPEYEKKAKLYSTRQYLIMIKETIDEYKRKKEYLKELKRSRDYFEQQYNSRENEMSKKVTSKIMNKRMLKNDTDPSSVAITLRDTHGSEFGTDATSQDEWQHARIIPKMNDEVEKILLDTMKEKNQVQAKLTKAKDLVFSACGLVGRICKEIRISNKNGSTTTVDVNESNILKYMSLCGLKFEKLMRNNKLIKAQYERLVEINMKRGIKRVDIFNTQNEAEIYGFMRINVNIDKNEKSEANQDN